MERLQKFLARAGLASRRHAEELITAGRVKVNGEVVTVLGTRVGPEDLIFSSATGVISCALAFGCTSAGPTPLVRVGVAWNRYLAIVAGYVLWLGIAWATGLWVMTAAVAGMILLGGALLWKTPALVRPARWGAGTFCVFSGGAGAAAFAVCPDFPSLGGPPAGPGARLLPVPAGEIVWVLVYGGVFPALFASVTVHRTVVAPVEPASADRLLLAGLDMEPDR
jgi:hypothetical protein